MNVSFTWATYGLFSLIADEGTDPQRCLVRLHLVLPQEVGIEPLDGWARWHRLASIGWARAANTTPAASSLEERFHRLCIQAASPPKVQLVCLLTEKVGTLVLRSTLLSYITGTICSCQRTEQQKIEKKCHLSSKAAADTLLGNGHQLDQLKLPNQFNW